MFFRLERERVLLLLQNRFCLVLKWVLIRTLNLVLLWIFSGMGLLLFFWYEYGSDAKIIWFFALFIFSWYDIVMIFGIWYISLGFF
jgi:hypothetical protein